MVERASKDTPAEWARTFLFVPANRREWLDRAVTSGADAIVADLEDGVAEAHKDEARSTLREWLADNAGPSIFARVNAGERRSADLDAVSGRVDAVFVPKASNLQELDDIMMPVVAIIESAAGWFAARDVAAHPNVLRIAAGEQDLMTDLGVRPSSDERELLPFRMSLVAASAAAGVASPIGPVHMRIDDTDALRQSTERLRRMGFGARSAIHPAQIPVINEMLAPTRDELAWAERVLQLTTTTEAGAFLDDNGDLVDKPVIERAKRIIRHRFDT